MAHNVASPLRRKVIEAFQRYRTPLNMGIELPTIEAIKRFVAMGNGVALVPHLTVARELENGRSGAGPGGRTGDEASAAAGASAPGHAVLCGASLFATVRALAEEQGPPFYYHVERPVIADVAQFAGDSHVQDGCSADFCPRARSPIESGCV